jgi:DNA-binding SARP family transcriptional activator
MEYRILGPLEVRAEGRPLALGGAKQRAVLAILLLNANNVVSSARLIDELWGEDAPESAAKGLQGYVSGLRKVLDPQRDRAAQSPVLVTRPPGYAIELAPEELDAIRFERLRAEARVALAAGEPKTAGAMLREALGLWRGPPLADFAYASFARTEIDRLEELRVGALEDRIDVDLALGGHAEVVGELEALIDRYPLRERFRGQLMLALYRSGRQAEALDVYRRTRRVLVDELGIEPMRDLQDLERAILLQDSSLDLASPLAEADGDTDVARGVFVGRQSELAELATGLDATIAGQGHLFLLVGEPGIGKTRLAEEVTREARARGARVLLGRCWEAGGAPAFWPWVQSLRMYVEQSDPDALRAQLGGGAADVAQIVPELRALFPDLPEPGLDTEGARFRLFDSAARFLRNAAATRPLVIVLDDLHAADEPSLLLLRFVAGELSGTRILVVGTCRDVDPTVREPLASTLAELAREQVTRRMELGGLTEADVGRYIELGSGSTAPKTLVAAIHAETEGNPLFVGEVARLLAAEGNLAGVDAHALWTLGVPQGVREVIGRRLGRLSGDCQRVLTLASVLGREFGRDALERLTELRADDLLEALDEAVAARVLSSVPGSPGRLRFAHALIRQTLYDQLTAPRRAQLHRRAGVALEALYEQDPDPHLAELAHHFVEAAPAGDLGKALEYTQLAGDRALKLLAFEEAARFYRLALQTLELRRPVDPEARCSLLASLGDVLARAGSTTEAKETFVAAADLARTAALPRQLARAALGYGGRFPWLRAERDSRLVSLLEEGLEALADEESVLRVTLMARLACALRNQPSLEPRSSLSHEAVRIARRLGDPDTLAVALISLGTATMGPDAEELMEIAEEATRLAEETGLSERALDACWLRRIALLSLGRTDLVVAVAEEHRALADELKQPTHQWDAAVMRSTWSLFRGEFSEAERLAEEALHLGERSLSWDAGFSYRFTLFTLRREQGRLGEIEDLVRRSVHDYAGYRLVRCLVALLECELGREDDARREFEELATADFAAFPRNAEWLFCLCSLAEVAAHLQDRDRAAILHRLLDPYARLNVLVSGEVTIGSAARYLGILASTMTRWDDAESHFNDALEANARMGARPWLAHTQHDYARMLLARDVSGDRHKAELLLGQARTSYRELGMARDDPRRT